MTATLTTRRVLLLLAGFYLLNLLVCGVYAPWDRLENHAAIARDLFDLDPAGPLFAHSYYLEAPLHFLGAHLLGATARVPYLVYCTVLVLGGYALFAWLGRRRWGGRGLLLMGVVLVAHPVTYILHTWLGLADGITFALTVVVLFTSSAPLAGIAAALGMLNHPMFALIFAGVLAVRWAQGEVGWRFVAVGTIGLAAGRLTAWWLLARSDAEVTSRLDFARDLLTSEALQVNTDWLPLLIYSFYFALLVPVVLTLPGLWRTRRRYAATYLVTQVVFAAVVVVTYDKTRVFALLSWATTVHYLATAAEMHAETLAAFVARAERRWLLVAVPVLALLMPHFFVTGDGGLWAPGFFFVWRHVGQMLGL